ncbi:hypothetical protein B0T10DRAFT_411653, partial [Thelonectria olida]
MLQDGTSIIQRAESYLLATAKTPLDVLTCTWERGTNRSVNRRHVSKLSRLFKEDALERQAEENYLLVQCSAQAVEWMMSHLGAQRFNTPSRRVFSFDDWSKVNPKEKVEVMTCQHRIQALCEYVKQIGANAKGLWWTCNFYDRDKLPLELDIKLRVNRQDPSLPDTHGQIWTQLVMAASHDGALFQGNKITVEKQITDILRLNREDRFPIGRLVTLWKNKRWRSMITRWCTTTLGRSTLNISTWDWMASYRVDAYWFATFEQVLNVLENLPGDTAEQVHATDWAKIAATLPLNHTVTDVKRLFYPEELKEPNSSAYGQHRGALRRREGFLDEMDDVDYEAVYHHISKQPEMEFPEVQKLLKTTKEEGRIMMQVMTHVIAWINPRPTLVMD